MSHHSNHPKSHQTKHGLGKSQFHKPSKTKKKGNKKTRAELNEEGRLRKKLKNRKGLSAGSRFNQDTNQSKNGQNKSTVDPRLGSKTKIDLEQYKQELQQTDNPSLALLNAPETISRKVLFAELKTLENDDRLDNLLEKLEDEVELSEEEQNFVDQTLDRIDELYNLLGIDIPEGVDELNESEAHGEPSDDDGLNSDLMRILKS